MDRGLPPLPHGYEALGDTPGVMREAASHVRDLNEAASRLSDSLITIGLPTREWRSQKAYLNSLVPALPSITVGSYIGRLTEFATTQGATWLRGGQNDLDRFNEEVATLYKVTRALREASRGLQGGPPDPRNGLTLEQAFSHPRTMAALDGVGEILDDLDALVPYMRPVPMEMWLDEPPAAWPVAGESGSGPSESMSGRGPRTMARRARGKGGPAAALALLRGRLATLPKAARLAPLIAVPLLLVLVGGAFALTHLPGGGPLVDGTSHTVPTQGALGTPTRETTPEPTPLPTLKLTLTCRLRQTGAAITVHNASAVPVAWDAKAPSPFTAVPASGSLEPEKDATIQIARQGDSSPSGITVPVKAYHGPVTTSFSVKCP